MTSAIPPLVIYLLLLSSSGMRTIGLWPSVLLTVALLALVEWPRIAVALKGRIEQLNAEPFVLGAVALGGSQWHIFRTHLLPHLWPTLLHLVAAEMSRALLVMAQMGVFGVLFGGGVLVVVDNGVGGDRWIQTTGLPEWGSLLSDGRPYILSWPWIPLAPAAAFVIAVTGFTMLSQGLEEVNLSLRRIRERTTARLSPRWRWALAALPVLVLLWSYAGPRGGVEDPGLRVLRGYHVDVTAAFDPLDPTAEAAPLRQQVYYLATAADHAYAQLIDLFPESARERRPQVRLYESDPAFRSSVGAEAPPEILAWYSPGEPVRLSPEYLRGHMRWETERALGYELVKYLSDAAYGQTTIDPVAMGLYEISTAGEQAYRPEVRKLAGAPLLDLAELFATPVQGLGPAQHWVFAFQSAELVRFLEERLPAAELPGPAPDERWSLASLAERLGEAPAALAAEYEAHLQRRLRSASVLAAPGAMAWIPEGLPDAIAMRAESAQGGDDSGFISRTDEEHREGWTAWLTAARRAGLTQFDAMLLGWDRNDQTAWVLERLQFSDGRIVSGVVPQRWTQEDGSWAVGPVSSCFQV